MTDAIQKAREALEAFADPENWRLNGRFDPNSGNFDAFTFASSALAALDAETEGWRTMDSAPKDGRSRILAIDTKGRQFVAWWRGIDHKPHEDKPDWYISGTLIAAPTLVAWMPLPTPLPSPPEARS